MKKEDIVRIIAEQKKISTNGSLKKIIKEYIREAFEGEFEENKKPKRFIIQTRTGSFYLDVDYPNSIDYDENTRMLAGYVGRTPVAIKVDKEAFENLANNQEYCEAKYRVLDKHDSVENDCILSYDNTALNESRDYPRCGSLEYEPGMYNEELSEEEMEWLCDNFPESFTINFTEECDGDGWNTPRECWSEPDKYDVRNVKKAIASIPDEHIRQVVDNDFDSWLEDANPEMDYDEPDPDDIADAKRDYLANMR